MLLVEHRIYIYKYNFYSLLLYISYRAQSPILSHHQNLLRLTDAFIYALSFLRQSYSIFIYLQTICKKSFHFHTKMYIHRTRHPQRPLPTYPYAPANVSPVSLRPLL